MNPDSLHSLVTSAIWHAEQVEEQHASAAPLAWAEVSALEEALAKALPVSQPEGRIARRGAVRAALKAEDYPRAHALAQHYLTEEGTSEALSAALRKMLDEDERILASRPHNAPKGKLLESPKIWERFYLRKEGWRITNVSGVPKGFPFDLGTTFLVGRRDQAGKHYCLIWLDQSGLVRTLDGVSLKGGQLEVTLAVGADKLRIVGNVARERNKDRIEGILMLKRGGRAKRPDDDNEAGWWAAEGVGGGGPGGVEAEYLYQVG